MIDRVKELLSGVLREGEAGGPGDGYGGGVQGQGPETRLWEMDLPAFIERCLTSSISDPQALPVINDLFKVHQRSELLIFHKSITNFCWLSIFSRK